MPLPPVAMGISQSAMTLWLDGGDPPAPPMPLPPVA